VVLGEESAKEFQSGTTGCNVLLQSVEAHIINIIKSVSLTNDRPDHDSPGES
jgi:hypothetical protein